LTQAELDRPYRWSSASSTRTATSSVSSPSARHCRWLRARTTPTTAASGDPLRREPPAQGVHHPRGPRRDPRCGPRQV